MGGGDLIEGKIRGLLDADAMSEGLQGELIRRFFPKAIGIYFSFAPLSD
jgi:hypothetical protein